MNSIAAEKPDMRFVPNGSRNQTNSFLSYSVFVAIFAILLGGWLLSNEYQMGTIRLLMIRPKTRTKIMFSKYTAALLICLGVFFAGCLINLIMNGILAGFSDYSNPNYTILGQVNFFSYYLPRLFACAVPIIFLFSMAFMLSVLLKNSAIAIIVPIVCYFGGSLVTQAMMYTQRMHWLAMTPIPYVNITTVFSQEINIYNLSSSMPEFNFVLGIGMLLAFAALFTVVSWLVFKNQDITS
jgi:ABC-2 type transport system permease protein